MRHAPLRRTVSPLAGDFARAVASTVVLLTIAASSLSAAEPTKFWQKMVPTKQVTFGNGSPQATKTPAELPPKEAARACLATAEQLQQQGCDREATLLFERARVLDPKQTRVCRNLAMLYDRQGEFPKALVEYEKALKLAPKDPELLNDVGYLHYQRGEWSQAETWFRKALEIDPNLERASINLAMTFAQQGRYAESFAAFEKVIGPAAAHSNMGVILARQNRTQEAINAFRQALALQPDLKPAQAFLAHLSGVKASL
jgi:Tfp pilus assembly protein PilF